jgi:predicted amidophosphoribosyltransferase
MKATHEKIEPARITLRQALIDEGLCPECLSPLNHEYYCASCGYDDMEEVDESDS